MGERFLDRVLHFMGIQDEEELEDDELAATEDDLEPSDSRFAQSEDESRQGRVINMPSKESRRRSGAANPNITAVPGGGIRMRMVVVEPTSFDEVQSICDHLKERRPVIVSVEDLDKELSKRIIDFVSGTTYAIDGNIQRVGESIFIFTPSGVQVEADVRQQWEPEV
ncbi:MAG: cell division protein SepF [Limnochordia bacterium]